MASTHAQMRAGFLCASALACGFNAGGIGSGGDDLAQGSDATGVSTSVGPGGGIDTTATSGLTQGATAASTDGGGSSTDATGGPDATDADISTTSATAESTGPGLMCSDGWWNPKWSRRRQLQIADGGIGEALDDAVVLVRLDPSRIDYALAHEKGADVRVIGAGNELSYEIERWTAGGDSELWVRIPTVTPGMPTEVHLYYGNPEADKASSGSATWAADFVSVHHLHSLHDSTGLGHDAASATPPTPTAGLVADAQDFDGVDDFLELPVESDFDFTTALTVEAWIRVGVFDVSWQAMVTKGDDAWRLHRANNTSGVGFGSDPPNHNLNGVIGVADGGWHYVAITYGNGIKRVWVDGVQDVEGALAGPLQNTAHAVRLGDNVQMTGRNFDGTIDEVRISAVERTSDWFTWQYASVSGAGVVTFGDEELCE